MPARPRFVLAGARTGPLSLPATHERTIPWVAGRESGPARHWQSQEVRRRGGQAGAVKTEVRLILIQLCLDGKQVAPRFALACG